MPTGGAEKPALEADGLLHARPAPGGHPGPAGLRARIVVLPEAAAEARGIVYRRGAEPFLLAWSRVDAAHSAEVGEPEGVQTVIFDLVLAGRPDARCRLDADPGEPARRLAEAIVRGIGRTRCSASLRAVALEGYATRSYPDLDSYEDDVPEEIRRSA